MLKKKRNLKLLSFGKKQRLTSKIIAEKLDKTLQEEYSADEKLNSLATNQINKEAE